MEAPGPKTNYFATTHLGHLTAPLSTLRTTPNVTTRTNFTEIGSLTKTNSLTK